MRYPKIKTVPRSEFQTKGPKTKKFRQTQVIKQVGATPIKTQRGTVFKLGGGIFSKRQIIASRRRFVRVKAPALSKKIRKSDFGL